MHKFVRADTVPEGHESQVLGAKLILIQQDMVVAGTVGALNAGVAVQVEVKLCGVADVPVYESTYTAQKASTLGFAEWPIFTSTKRDPDSQSQS